MPLTAEEGKAKRLEGLRQEKMGLSAAGRVHRAFSTGRPPASELRTPLAAVTAARTLQRELLSKMSTEGLTPGPRDMAVSVAFVTPDLSVIGYTNLYRPDPDPKAKADDEAEIAARLDGNIAIGLIFGIVDPDATEEEGRILMGARPFLVTKQTDGWLEELLVVVRSEFDLPY